MAGDLFAEYEYIKFQNEKAHLLSLFYDMQNADDDEDGLSPAEFKYLLYDLDEHILERFSEFDQFDLNGDGVIDINEFETVLDNVYRDIFPNVQMRGANRTVGGHYNRQNTIDHHAMDDQKERHKIIDREKSRRYIGAFNFKWNRK